MKAGAARALAGVLAGTLVVLILHPASRPFIGQGFVLPGASRFLQTTDSLPENLDELPPAKNQEDAALWMLTACERMARRRLLSSSEWARAAELAQRYGAEDPTNAFWPQMEAMALWRIGRVEDARSAWRRAARARRWDDRQTERLNRVLQGLSREAGRTLAWHYAFAYERRSRATSVVLAQFGRQMLEEPPDDPLAALRLRVATVENAERLRDGSRSARAAESGVALVDEASLASPRVRPASPRGWVDQRNGFLVQVREQLGEEEGRRLVESYAANDAWRALVNPEWARRNAQTLAGAAVLSVTLPGAVLWIGAVGLVCLGLGALVGRAGPAFRPPWVLALGTVFAVGIWLWTRLPLPTLFVFGSFAAFCLPVRKPRPMPSSGMGSSFCSVQAIIAACLAAALAAFLMGVSTPGLYLLGSLGVSEDLGTGSTVLLSLAAILLSMCLATGPVWALIDRRRPNEVAGAAVMRVGMLLAVGGLALGSTGTLVAVAADQALASRLSRMVQNEPTYILTL